MTRTRMLEVAAFALLSAVAIAGWVHNSGTANAANQPYAQPYAMQQPYATNQPYAMQQPYADQGAAPNATQAGYDSAAPCGVPPENVGYGTGYYNEPYYSASRPVQVRQASAGYQSRPVYYSHPARRGRSTKRSIALIAGSAGVGAAIGALAGGGKGAGIGALGGGAAGLIYDRLTHKTHSGL